MWWLYDYIVEPLGLNYAVSYCFPNMSMFMRLFTYDSVCSSTRYILNYLNLYKSPSPSEPNQIQEDQTIKYLYLTINALVYYSIYILSWNSVNMSYLYELISIISSPIIMHYLQFPELTKKITNMKQEFTTLVVCKSLSKSLNHICIKNLNIDPKVNWVELKTVMNVENLKYAWIFLKILLITSLINYFKKVSYYSSVLLKVLYESGNIIEIPDYHKSIIITEKSDPKTVLRKIVTNRKWKYLYDPLVLNMILELFQEQEGDLIKDFIDSQKRRILKFVSLWSLGEFIPVPLLSLIFTRDFITPNNPNSNPASNPNSDQNPNTFDFQLFLPLIFPASDLIMYVLYPNSTMYLALWSAYMPLILETNLLSKVYTEILNYTPIIHSILTHKQKYNFYLCISAPVVYFVAQENLWYLFLLPFIARYNFIYIWLAIFGYLSNYDLIHLMTLSFILYIIINIYDYQATNWIEIKNKLVQSYYRR